MEPASRSPVNEENEMKTQEETAALVANKRVEPYHREQIKQFSPANLDGNYD